MCKRMRILHNFHKLRSLTNSLHLQILSWLLPQEEEPLDVNLGRSRRRPTASGALVANLIETLPALHNSLVLLLNLDLAALCKSMYSTKRIPAESLYVLFTPTKRIQKLHKATDYN